MPYQYDVLLSHNSKDKPTVETIAKNLEHKYDLKCWLDKWNLIPGEPWQEALEEALDQCETVAVFVGPSTISPWENEEMRSALEERVRDKTRRVIPVLLPGAPDKDALNLPRFLKRLTWVDMRAGLDDADALHRLWCGIRGIAPGEQVKGSAAVPDVRTAESVRLYYPTQTVETAKASPGRKRIFLSYKRGAQPDEALALALHEALSLEHDVFIDQIMPVGTEWRARIRRELEACDFLVPLLSASSAYSEMVEYEISNAHQLARSHEGKPGILPVRVAYTAPFEYPLSAYLNPLNWSFWRNEQDTPPLIAELRTAIAGGQLNIADLKEKRSLLVAAGEGAIPRPTAFADIGQIERPDGTMEVESRFYIERPGDAVCQREVGRGGATIVIKAPRQMGKSSLLVRAAAQARRLGREVAFLDFQLLDEAMLGDPGRFFQGFCRWIADELDLDAPVEPAWESGLGHVQSSTKYVRRQALKGLSSPVTLVMDEVDRMLGCPFRSDFFGMLRSWHNNRATSPDWRKLDILLVISTEPYLLIDDLKQSPFNVGEVIRLEDFSLAQTAELNDRHGSPFDPPQIERLYHLLNGHPYLTRQALYRAAVGENLPEAILTNAPDENGPFGDHLRRHLTRFSERPNLARAMLQVIRQQACEDDILYSRLHGAGLAMRAGEYVMPRCELYAQYFRERLSYD